MSRAWLDNIDAQTGTPGARSELKPGLTMLGGARGDQIAVVSGLKAGEEVVTSGVFKLRNGAAVTVNNKIQPGNSLAPTPEDS